MFKVSPRFLLCSGTLLLISANAQVQQSDWTQLNTTVRGRLHAAIPYAQSCFSIIDGGNPNTPNPQVCSVRQTGNSVTAFRLGFPEAYGMTQWETCQANDDECLLDHTDPTNSAAFSPPRVCSQGSVPPFYIDVSGSEDVVAAFAFSARTGVPLVIKNSGHDYKGRSSAPGSLALWVSSSLSGQPSAHHAALRHTISEMYGQEPSMTLIELKCISTFVPNFIPDGCEGTPGVTAFTMGAGQQFDEVYDFAEKNNVTFVGGAATTVGPSGGWVQGGGHSALSTTLGLGVDRVLQFKIVTPDGQFRIANKCTNTDLFFALRGGGGGTFGVVIESSHLVTPQVQIQTANVVFKPSPANTKTLIKDLAAHTVQWAADGWGGHINPSRGGVLYVNPLLDPTAAAKSMAPMVTLINSMGGNVTFGTSPSYTAFFREFVEVAMDPVGLPFTMATRLIPAASFNNTQLIDAIVDSSLNCSFPQILSVGPISFKGSDNNTAVTPAWRNSIWHVIAANIWNYNSTVSDRVASYQGLEKVMNPIRQLTPGSGAYVNEADIYEPDWQNSFWGSNYPRLLAVKRKYDPHGLLDCWQCVGWKGAQDPRYKCHLAI